MPIKSEFYATYQTTDVSFFLRPNPNASNTETDRAESTGT
jgi:hypothetical protein